MNDVRMDLKVCEGCGMLWLRSALEARVYCRRCTVKLAEFPAVRARHIQVRKPRINRALQVCAGGAR